MQQKKIEKHENLNFGVLCASDKKRHDKKNFSQQIFQSFLFIDEKMILNLFFCFLFVNLAKNEEFSADYIGDNDHFDVIYNLHNENVEEQLQKLLQEAPQRVYSMKTVDQEDYQCILPVVERMASFFKMKIDIKLEIFRHKKGFLNILVQVQLI